VENESLNHYRIGVEVGPYDPYWVQVKEAVCDQLAKMGVTQVRLDIAETNQTFYEIAPTALADELLAHELDALIVVNLPHEVSKILLGSHLPLISVSEEPGWHPCLTSRAGLYEAGKMAGEFIGKALNWRGTVMCVGGVVDLGYDKGQSRIEGFHAALDPFPEIKIHSIPSFWDYERAYEQARTGFQKLGQAGDAIFGLSDSLILAARDAARDLGFWMPNRVTIGVNGDPLALAAIAEGSLTATVETPAKLLGMEVAQMAIRAAQKLPLPAHYKILSRLITRENVATVALEKLVAIANIPTQLVGVNRQQQQNRLRQLEISSEINRRVGALLDRKRLCQEIAGLIRDQFNYDYVQVLLWSDEERALTVESSPNPAETERIPLEESGLLREALKTGLPIFIPDAFHSQRYPPDPRYPETRARVVLPVGLGDQVIGLLDLHSRRPSQYLRQELVGLQPLADQLGIALRNSELYAAAVKARERAERADQLKTRLLANVSHELRAPLNVILGYSLTALQTPNPYHVKLPQELLRDLRYIYQGGEHLMRIINDLLDVSRAEIGELDLFTETLQTRPFLVEAFNAFTRGTPANPKIQWRMEIPPALPVIQADPVRLRQILLNLLSNAARFTTTGHITLGAAVEPPHIHLWVEDTGPGIPVEQQELIFEPFVSIEQNARRREGVGLGLSITRHLVALHRGSLSLESQPGRGSIFHFYLPLPNLSNQPNLPLPGSKARALFVIASHTQPPQDIQQIAVRQGMEMVLIRSVRDLEKISETKQPAALAWDMSSASTAEWQLIQHLQAQPHFEQMPFILFKKEDQDVDLRTGLTHVLLKPVNRHNLADFLKGLYESGSLGSVLIADDDPQARELYAQIVSQALPGYTVQGVENGMQLLEALKHELPALILLDLMMPEMDGFTVLQKLRSDPRTARLPVMVISGQKLSLDDVQRLDYARVTFHTKGLLSPDEAVEMLRQTFAGKDILYQPTSRLVKYALVYMIQNYAQTLTRKELADQTGVSENYLSQIFRQELGISPWECLTRLRIQQAKELLTSGEETITHIATRVGFNDSAYFSRVFHKMTGMSPQEYRLEGREHGS
jgi:signal transduction histidine kinase/AraC-like DNA-binding protein/ABC-type sugar transport system substrate-binding protein